jgi:hypothetical protein
VAVLISGWSGQNSKSVPDVDVVVVVVVVVDAGLRRMAREREKPSTTTTTTTSTKECLPKSAPTDPGTVDHATLRPHPEG